jgi:hypothetical protein
MTGQTAGLNPFDDTQNIQRWAHFESFDLLGLAF